MGISRGRLLLVAAGVLSSPAGCTTLHQVRPVGVVIITLDTVRADRLSVYGAMDAPVPHLERLAQEGIVFDQATSVAPLTLPAHCSLLTGLFPPSHGVRDNADPALAADRTTLAEILHGQGFRTGAFVGSVVLGRDRGLAQGFDHYSEVGFDDVPTPAVAGPARQRRADAVVDDAIAWLAGVEDSRFFLWTHLYDPHRPYDPPEPYRSRHPDPYIGEIAFADAQIGRLIGALEQRRLLDRTLVFVVGDHGESLGEHGERDHGIFVYQSVLHVPLIIRVPRLTPHRIHDVVRQVDIVPTVLDLLHLPPASMDGVSLVPLLTTDSHMELETYAESMYPLRFGWSPLRTVRDGRFKFIDAPRPELYDLERDPFEQRNLYDVRRPLADALRQRLTRHTTVRPPTAGTTVPDDVRERLASLGYAAGRAPAERTGKDLRDPKDCITAWHPLEVDRAGRIVDRERCR